MTEQDATPARLYAASTPDADVREAFTDGAFTVAVYGLGKMGLPLATVFGPSRETLSGTIPVQSSSPPSPAARLANRSNSRAALRR